MPEVHFQDMNGKEVTLRVSNTTRLNAIFLMENQCKLAAEVKQWPKQPIRIQRFLLEVFFWRMRAAIRLDAADYGMHPQY